MEASPFASLFACLLAGLKQHKTMNQTERYYRIDQLIQETGGVSFNTLMDSLEVSRATIKRDLQHMRDRLNAPIVFDKDTNGYRYVQSSTGPRFQLPGLWFSSDEALALMTMHQLLEGLDAGGLLGPHIKPLMQRLSRALGTDEVPAKEVLKRLKLMPSQQRRVQVRWFERVGKALMTRQRLLITYFTRYKNERSEREVSPQRLVHYRGNWYLDAWCHKSEGVRMFSLDSIESAKLTETKARDISIRQVDAETAQGYGIFRGKVLQWATLEFSAEAARWVRCEVWHEQQQCEDLPGDRYRLRVPYTESQELEMDLLRHGENVRVIEPAALRERVRKRLAAAVSGYDTH
jgi:predicted DNA-binding transcriptional regulator YafY